MYFASANPVPGLCFYWRYIPQVLCFCKSRPWTMFLLTLYTTSTLLLQIPSLDYVFIDVIYHMYFASANPVPGLCFYWRYIPHVLCFCKSRPWTMFLLTLYTTSTLLLQIPSLNYVFIDVIYHKYFASANPVTGLCFIDVIYNMYFASANPVTGLCFYWRYIPQVLYFCKSRHWTMFYWRYIPHVLCFCKSRHWTMFLLTLYTTCTLLLQIPSLDYVL